MRFAAFKSQKQDLSNNLDHILLPLKILKWEKNDNENQKSKKRKLVKKHSSHPYGKMK